MAIPKIKATYSLDLSTAETLARLAERWGVSKSEALRRSIEHAARELHRDAEGTDNPKLAAFRALQGSLSLNEEAASAWKSTIQGGWEESLERRPTNGA